ncbi:MAG: class I SAM-dependent methyltransferase [Candidatus Promineifilaceae bacterium]
MSSEESTKAESTSPSQPDPSQPKSTLLEKQAEWLAPARSRMLRRIGVARRQNILDLGAGYGSVSGELRRRSLGRVIALDHSWKSLREIHEEKEVFRIVGNAAQLPHAGSSFDLVFCQVGLLWMKPIQKIVREIWRVLRAGGIFLSIEPDYFSMIEYPEEIATRDIWINALTRAGGDPEVGRILPSILEFVGFTVRIDLLERIRPPSPFRFELLRELPLSHIERDRLNQLEYLSDQVSGWSQITHLPFILTTAEKR